MNTQKPTPPHLITLILLTAFATLSLNMFLPSLANIASDLNADYAVVSLAVSGYLAISAVIHLIVGPLSDRIGRRPVILGALVLFTGASLVCAFAEDIWVFLTFRMLQAGMVSGYALSMAIVRDTTSERKAAGLIGYISMAMAIAPMVGPMLGGTLDTMFGWRANFFFYSVTGIGLLILCLFDLSETRPGKTGDTGQNTGSVTTLLASGRFWAYSLCTALSTGAFYVFLTGAPLVAQTTFGVSTAELGIYIGSITGGFMVGSFVAGRFGPGFAPTTMMLAGRCIACLGLLIGMAFLGYGFLSPLLYFGSTICVGLGNGLTMPGSNAGAMSVFPKLAGTAAGFNGALTVACGALLTTITGLVLPQEGAAPLLLLLMFLASFGGLLTSVCAWVLERQLRSELA